ncbi:MAG: 23S rRNA (pseudouridine(1915)-N(3))-methyltransferase RlmH [Clostridia bacterium]|nr:23S rRNA (pseudouridine(1915)-N(3))-methyltransferase RlmH [Clostridia bacterium]
MITVRLIALGNLKEQYLRDAVSEYAKRLKGFCNFELIQLKEAYLPDAPSQNEINAALESEGDRILALLSPKAYKIAMCVEGTQLSSEDFAAKIEWITVNTSSSEIVFIIGSSHGICDRVKRACDFRMSVSKLTLPHQLMRVVMLEAVYRAFNIIKGTKYHK